MNELIFIYNANSGVVNSLIDWVHKIISPNTYKCSLCSVTYDNSGKKNEWLNFLKELNMKSSFLYKDNIINDKDLKKSSLPCVYLRGPNDVKLLISSAEMNMFKDLKELTLCLRKKLEDFK